MVLFVIVLSQSGNVNLPHWIKTAFFKLDYKYLNTIFKDSHGYVKPITNAIEN